MNNKTKAVGGGEVKGLTSDYINVLQSLLNSGGMGAAGSPDAFGTAGGVAGILRSLLEPGAGRVGGAYADILSRQSERDIAGLRSRFTAGGGMSFGTPAAYAESQYRAESAPRITQAIAGLQLSALLPLLQQIGGFAEKGVTQRQIVQEKSPFSQIAGTLAPIASAALPFLQPAFGGIPSAPNIGSIPDLSNFAPVYA